MKIFHSLIPTSLIIDCVWLLFMELLASVSVSWYWGTSPASVSGLAPSPGSVVLWASGAGASFVGVRPSARSFSRWVGVVWFSSRRAAVSFGRAVSSEAFGGGVITVRPCGGWWVVSVPVFVGSVRGGRFGRSLPLSVWAL